MSVEAQTTGEPMGYILMLLKNSRLGEIRTFFSLEDFQANQINDCQADQIDAANLVRVYGALLWNVGKARMDRKIKRTLFRRWIFWSG